MLKCDNMYAHNECALGEWKQNKIVKTAPKTFQNMDHKQGNVFVVDSKKKYLWCTL